MRGRKTRVVVRRYWRRIARNYRNHFLQPMDGWIISIMMMLVTWLSFLQGLAWLTVHAGGWARFFLLTAYLVAMTIASVEFGGRFRALGDRTKTYQGVFWASLAPVAMIPMVVVTSKPLERAFSDLTLTSIDAIVPASLAAWVWLLAAMLKLPWDTATTIRKEAHGDWTGATIRKARATSHLLETLGDDPWREERERLAAESAVLRASWHLGSPRPSLPTTSSTATGDEPSEIDVLKARATRSARESGAANARNGV
jgi:hypothetical protein